MSFSSKSILCNQNNNRIHSTKTITSNAKQNRNIVTLKNTEDVRVSILPFHSNMTVDSTRYKKTQQNHSAEMVNLEKSVTKILTSYFQGIFSTSGSPYNKSTPITINVHSNKSKKDPISKNREKISPLSVILSNQKKNFTTMYMDRDSYSFVSSRNDNKENMGYISNPTFHYYSNEIKIQLYYYIENNNKISFSEEDMNGKDSTLFSNDLDQNRVSNKNLIITKEKRDIKSSKFSYNSNIIYNHNESVLSSIRNENKVYNDKKGYQRIENDCKEDIHNNIKRINIMYSDLFSESNLLSLVSIIEQLYNKEKRRVYVTNQQDTLKVTLQCNQIHYPYMNRDILAKYIAHNLSSNTFINLQEIISNRIHVHNHILFNQIASNSSNSILNDSKYSFPREKISKDTDKNDILQNIAGQKNFPFMNRETTKKVHENSFLTSMITGIKVQLSGRLTTESVIPRVTQKSFQIGSFHQVGGAHINSSTNKQMNKTMVSGGGRIHPSSIQYNKPNLSNKNRISFINYSKPNLNSIDFSEYTTKNRIGAFTVKV